MPNIFSKKTRDLDLKTRDLELYFFQSATFQDSESNGRSCGPCRPLTLASTFFRSISGIDTYELTTMSFSWIHISFPFCTSVSVLAWSNNLLNSGFTPRV